MSLAPAVCKDGFAYAGDLFAEASGHNRHRRATPAELKDHFKSGSEKDHPAHWFEAQLIHYGLQPSKTKAVARMRLFDAVNGGKLTVPAHIKKLESELKKDWTKNERDAKKALKGPQSPAPAVKSAKRKAESENVDLTVSVGDINITVSANTSSKKAKAMTAKPAKPAAPSKPAAKAKPAAKPKPATPSTPKPKPKPKAVSEPRVKAESLTAPYSSFGSTTAAATPSRRAQTGRQSQAPPPAFKIEDSDDDTYGRSRSQSNYSGGADLKPLGLLNGRYSVSSRSITSQWGPMRKSLVLTLQGSELWGKFDLGIIEGILHFERRPYVSSEEAIDFRWRGREREGPMFYGNDNRGWLRFLGDGTVEGFLDYMSLDFEADRNPGQGTRSEIDARDMVDEWDGYNEREYERESRARWY